MARYETVSAKIPPELKEKISRYNVPTSKIIRQALEDEVKRRELEELERQVEELEPLLRKFTTEEVVRMIREDRDQR
jgi:antitoxin CcdA